MGRMWSFNHIAAAVGLLCGTFSVYAHGSEGSAHLIMRRERKEEPGSQFSSTSGESIPKTMGKKLLKRDTERRRVRREQQAQIVKTAAEQEKKYIASMWENNDSVPMISAVDNEGSHYKMKGAPGRIVLNLPAGHKKQNQLQRLFAWLQRQLVKHADHLVVLSAGYSLLNGGCSDKDIHERYLNLTNGAGEGPKVVIGAALGPASLNTHFIEAFGSQRRQELQKHKLRDGLYQSLAWCKGKPCKDPPTYEYPDFGFIMGSVREVHGFLSGIYSKKDRDLAVYVDVQSATMHYMMQNPKKVVLDYGSQLVLSLNGFNHGNDVLEIRQGELRNTVTEDAQCFVHAAGSSYDWAIKLSAMLREYSE